MTFTRRQVLAGGAVGAGALAFGPLRALGATAAPGAPMLTSEGYGPLVAKGELFLPAAFDYQVISRQGEPMSDGRPTPGIFDGMAAYTLGGDHGDDDDDDDEAGQRIVLIRNHENRERAGEIKVVTGPALEYDAQAFGGNTKLVLRRTGNRAAPFVVERQFAILGGTSTNCAGGVVGPLWITCEEVVKRSSNGKGHGYVFPIDSRADGPVPAVPIRSAGRFAHEAVAHLDGWLYQTEDRRIAADPGRGLLGALFYRWRPTRRTRPERWGDEPGVLQALRLRDEPKANMDVDRTVGRPYRVDWVTIDEPDHDDDTDTRLDRAPGSTPTRVQGVDKGAAMFDRPEGMWVGGGRVYFDCTTGGARSLGQVWEHDPRRQTLTLIYESTDPARLEAPDNLVVVPATGDLFLQEDGQGEQFVRGLTPQGEIYDFAKTAANDTEFCGGCFSPDGRVFFLNQQGDRGALPSGPANANAVTYAIFGPFGRRAGHDDD